MCVNVTGYDTLRKITEGTQRALQNESVLVDVLLEIE
jgi:hypothetical protein